MYKYYIFTKDYDFQDRIINALKKNLENPDIKSCLTHWDDRMNSNMQDWVDGYESWMQRIPDECQGRVVIFDYNNITKEFLSMFFVIDHEGLVMYKHKNINTTNFMSTIATYIRHTIQDTIDTINTYYLCL